MIRLTLRTLLAYLDDTLPPADAKVIGQKLAENEDARQLAERIRVLARKRSLSTPGTGAEGSSTDPNVVAAYLSDSLNPEMVEKFEKVSLESDLSLAELAACHQILTLLLSDQVRVPPSAYKRMYALVKGRESIPGRTPGRQAMPVGGVTPTEKPNEADEADAAYLLGMPAYSRTEPLGRKVIRWAVGGLLACGFLVAASLAWWSLPRHTDGAGHAAVPTDRGTVLTTTPPGEDQTRKDEPKTGEPQQPGPNPVEPKKEEPVKERPKKEEPVKEQPKKEDLGTKPPPNENRGVVGVNDAADEQVLVVKKPAAEGWERVKKGAEVNSTDRLVCLPGYRAKVQFKSGVTAELWGNVPGELLPLPVAETSLTAHLPPDGIDADLTLHAGRVYVGHSLERPAVVRVRVRDVKYPVKDLVLDVTIPDKASELAVEVQHALSPGAASDPSRTVTVLYAVRGTASIPLKAKPTTIATGQVLVFDSVRGVADGPRKTEEQGGQGLAYFDREPVYENPDKSRATLKALRQIADRLRDVKSVTAAVSEQRSEPTPATDLPVFVAGAVWSVFASAALGDVTELTDLLNDPNRQGIRATAVAALRGLLAGSPDKLDSVRATARERWKLSAADTDSLLDTLAGLQERARRDKDTLNKLAEQLNAETVAQREAALFVLLTEVDPAAQRVPQLTPDVADSADKRTAAVNAWKQRIAELTR